MINKRYLEWLSDYFGVLASGPWLQRSAEDAAKKNRDSGFSSISKAKNYSDIYTVRVRSHPELEQFAEWYSSGEKVWPQTSVTPTAFKHLYVGDGTLLHGRHVVVSTTNEWENRKKIERIFSKSVIPSPDRYNDAGQDIVWNKKKSERIFQLIGGPVPGFERKWKAQATD
jgi:hypothetical protein